MKKQTTEELKSLAHELRQKLHEVEQELCDRGVNSQFITGCYVPIFLNITRLHGPVVTLPTAARLIVTYEHEDKVETVVGGVTKVKKALTEAGYNVL